MKAEIKHKTIPIFIPELACPFRCIYCNQHVISGQQEMPSDQEIINTIESYLVTFSGLEHVELGFFGGTFTGLSIVEQSRLLDLVSPYLKQGKIRSIRVSTRPDYITPEIISNLKGRGVATVELGVQSFSAEVLQAVGRGYDPWQVEAAAKIIQNAGLELGMQMMIGLPSDTPERSMYTTQRIIQLGATNTRIYPTLVIPHTVLASLYEQGRYQPLTIPQAVLWTAPILKLFEESGITVLRVGLHPTPGFINGTDYLAGPFHVSFKELVVSEIWRQTLIDSCAQYAVQYQSATLVVEVPVRMLNAAVGYNASNKKWLQSRFKKVKFIPNHNLQGYHCQTTLQIEPSNKE